MEETSQHSTPGAQGGFVPEKNAEPNPGDVTFHHDFGDTFTKPRELLHVVPVTESTQNQFGEPMPAHTADQTPSVPDAPMHPPIENARTFVLPAGKSGPGKLSRLTGWGRNFFRPANKQAQPSMPPEATSVGTPVQEKLTPETPVASASIPEGEPQIEKTSAIPKEVVPAMPNVPLEQATNAAKQQVSSLPVSESVGDGQNTPLHAPEAEVPVSEEQKTSIEEAHVDSAAVLPRVEIPVENTDVSAMPQIPNATPVQAEEPVVVEEKKPENPIEAPVPVITTPAAQQEAEKQQQPNDPDAYARKMLFRKRYHSEIGFRI